MVCLTRPVVHNEVTPGAACRVAVVYKISALQRLSSWYPGDGLWAGRECQRLINHGFNRHGSSDPDLILRTIEDIGV